MEEVLDVFGVVEGCGRGGAFGGFAFAAGFAGVYSFEMRTCLAAGVSELVCS